ncbi:MAG: hypothetical protein WEE64_07800 [Dehalococcoidia bacterium]
MNELSDKQVTILTDLLAALDGGAGLEACLARFPNDAHALRPYLELHTQLLSQQKPAPSAADYDAGREALLERLASSPAPATGLSLRDTVAAAWTRVRRGVRRFELSGRGFQPALMRVAAFAAIFLLIGGGTLGASAAAGFRPSRAVLSSVGLMERPPANVAHVEGDDDAGATPGPNRDDDDGGTNEPGESNGGDDGDQVVRPPESDGGDDGGDGDPSRPDDDQGVDVLPTLPGGVDVPPIEAPPVVVIDPTPAPLDRLCMPRDAVQWYPQLAQYVRTCTADEFAALIAPLGNTLCVPQDLVSRLPLLLRGLLPVCSNAQAQALPWLFFAKGYCVPQAIAQRVPATSANALHVCTPDAILAILLESLPQDECLSGNLLDPILCPNEGSEGSATDPIDGLLGGLGLTLTN